LAAELKVLNERNAAGVQNHDLTMRLSFYADDTLLMPRNSVAKVGMAEIRPYLTAYVENGRGATFDAVRVWTEDCQDLGSGYALEYFRFQVDWRSRDKAGTVSGGGVRLWRRGPDGELKMLREIGTHDYRPS
jgi:ketosteroid isomerase-like protein